DLTQRKPARWVVRTGWTSSQPSHPFGEWVVKTLGYKRVVTIGIDYAFGWEVVGGFQKTFEEAGGQIIQKLWPPLGTTDFAPYLSQVRRDNDAAKSIGGDVEDREKFLAALRKVEVPDAPRGPVKLDAYGNPIQNIYVRKVEKKDGELWNTVIQTFPAVSQFGKYKPEEFLKQ